MVVKIEPGSLTHLMDDLIALGVPIEAIRVISAGVRQAVTDANKKTRGLAPKDPRGFLKRPKGGA